MTFRQTKSPLLNVAFMNTIARQPGARDGRDLEFVIRDETGDVVGAALGYSWAGIAELRQLWVAKGYRGRGMGRSLLIFIR